MRLAVLTARGGRVDDAGWPTAGHIRYPWVAVDDGVPHPADPGVVLGTTGTALGAAAAQALPSTRGHGVLWEEVTRR